MLINNETNSLDAMKELSVRFKQHRVSCRITQKELSEKTGVSLRTISRFENGEEISVLTFIKLIKGVGLLHNLETIIADYTRRPSYFATNGNLPKRARKKEYSGEWKWGDEK